MADVELVIKIPEVYFEALKKTDVIVSGQRNGKTLMSVIYGAVAKGIPLPKRHGGLIDVNELEECKEIMNTIDGESKYAVRMDDIRNTPTIIEGQVEE